MMYLSHPRCGIYLIGYYIPRSRARNRSGLGIFTPWLVSKIMSCGTRSYNRTEYPMAWPHCTQQLARPSGNSI